MRRTHIFLLSTFLMLSSSALAQEVKAGDYIVMSAADFGLTTNLRSWDATSKVVNATAPVKIKEEYTMPTGKKKHCSNEGTECVYTIENGSSDQLLLTLRHYKDGYAFRYTIKNLREGEQVTAENTTFHVPSAAKRWLQQYNGPGYEHFFPLCEGGVSPEGAQITRWGYPALFEITEPTVVKHKNIDGTYILVSDSYDPKTACSGSILTNTTDDRNTYHVTLLGAESASTGAEWNSAWHVMITGSLADVVESTLVTDVAPAPTGDFSWVMPGVSSWVYWANNHGSQDYNILKEYVDLAVDMQWPYTLVDAEWDVMRNGDIKGICDYAVSHGVKPMIWYNSTTNWTGSSAPTPQGLLNNPDSCDAEFAKIASWGVKGVKIDFFREDWSETTAYYYNLLQAAAKHHLLVNFHGGTIPHGWQRTYPNVITCEGVYGAEWYNNNGIMTGKAAAHNATLPFTRNIIGPMDYTPGTFSDSQHPHLTTSGHELALPFIFESGMQHMPDRPASYLKLNPIVRSLLKELPVTWDETRLISGYPGESIVIARRKSNTWYIAGINGTDDDRKLSLVKLKELGIKNGVINFYCDNDNSQPAVFGNAPFMTYAMQIKSKYDIPSNITCKPKGGFVLKITNPNF